METNKKVTRCFSGPLMKQDIKANWVLCLAIALVMILMSSVMNYAVSLIEPTTSDVDVTEYQEDFYTYLSALATYNSMAGTELSYEDFAEGDNEDAYEMAFEMLNAQADMDLSVDEFQESIDGLSQSGVEIDVYVTQFEYAFALAQTEGVFDGEELTVEGVLNTTFEMMGVDSEMIEKISEMDTTAMINEMYYTLTALLPILILIVILANNLIANQVDRGSMAYVLSTPTKRFAVANTQAIFMVVVPFIVIGITCISRIITTNIFFDEINVASILALFGGMYVLVEAICGICYLASCWFSQSKYAMGIGGGLTVWFFLAKMIGLFGSEDMVNVGVGVEQLGVFNNLTLIGLYDVGSLATVGTDAVDYDFVWKLCVLGAIAIVCYIIGEIRFSKKDLPL